MINGTTSSPARPARAIAAAPTPVNETMATVKEDSAPDAAQEEEWLRQNNLMNAALIAISLIMVQPFLTAASLNLSAKIAVMAFAVAIPLLAALVMLNWQESFRRSPSKSRVVSAAKALAQLAAFVGVVAAFWHILWFAGVGILVSGVVATLVHSAGYVRLEYGKDA